MSKEKFTKGSRGVVINSAGSVEVVFKGGSPVRGDEYLSIIPCSSMRDDENINSGETVIANDHLIKSAPKMYEMLNFIMENPSELNVIHIRKLLAEARGE